MFRPINAEIMNDVKWRKKSIRIREFESLVAKIHVPA